MGGFDEAVLATAIKRREALAVLASGPHHRREIEATLDLSKTTCHRILRRFDEQGLLERTDSGYELTRLGEIVHEQVEAFEATTRLAYRLEPLIETLERAGVAFEIEQFAGARVTEPEPGDPYSFARRTMELFENSETIRVLDCNPLVPPVYVEQMLDVALETGMRGEFVVTPEIAVGNMEQFPDRQRQVAESDEASGRYFVLDEIQFGLAIYDDHLDLRIYDEETGTPILYVDTSNPDAINWAIDRYRAYRDRARPATTLAEFPDWAPDTGLEPPETRFES